MTYIQVSFVSGTSAVPAVQLSGAAPPRIVRFPVDFPRPFAGTEEEYRAIVDDPAFEFENTRLEYLGAPELYDPDVQPSEYPRFAMWRLVLETAKEP